MFKITSALAAKIDASLTNGGRTSEMVAHEVICRTPMDLVKVRVPGVVSATFKRDEDVGQTFGKIHGSFSVENILNVQGERIQRGEFVGRLRASEDVRASFNGQARNGETAVESMLLACFESDDPECNEWAAKVVEGAFTVETPPTPEVKPKKSSSKKTKKTVDELVGKV